MANINNKSQMDQHKMHHDIEDLIGKYEELNKEVEDLKSNKASIEGELKEFHGEFEKINKSVEQILQKIDKLSGGKIEKEEEADEGKADVHSMKKMFKNPLRKFAVGTLSVVYAVVDKTVEKTFNIKESFEDIVAEAQYANKKKKMKTVEES